MVRRQDEIDEVLDERLPEDSEMLKYANEYVIKLKKRHPKLTEQQVLKRVHVKLKKKFNVNLKPRMNHEQ